MRVYPFILLFLGLLPGLLPTLTGQESRLSFQLQQGRSYSLDIDIQQSTSSEASNSAEITISSNMVLRFRVDSVDAYGSYHMNVGYERLRFSMIAPGLGLDMNSARESSPLLHAMLDHLTAGEFRVTMLPSGELRELGGLKEIFRQLENLPAGDSTERSLVLQSLNEAYGPRAFRGLFELFVSYFPAIQPMRNWTRDITYYFNTKPVKMVNRYFLARTSEDLVTIQGMGMLNSMSPYEETIELGRVESYLTGTQTYDYQVDKASGWLRKCVSRQRVMVEATILESRVLPQGLKIPSYTETLFEVHGKIHEEP